MVSDIPAGDLKIANLSLQCISWFQKESCPVLVQREPLLPGVRAVGGAPEARHAEPRGLQPGEPCAGGGGQQGRRTLTQALTQPQARHQGGQEGHDEQRLGPCPHARGIQKLNGLHTVRPSLLRGVY